MPSHTDLDVLSREQKKVINLVLGYPLGPAVVSTLRKWYHTNGPEWLTSRLKAYWQVAIQLKAGDKVAARKICQEQSISYHRNTGVPKGPLGAVVARFEAAKTPGALRRLAMVFRIYTAFRLEETSQAQLAKMEKSICGCSTAEADLWKDRSQWEFLTLMRSEASRIVGHRPLRLRHPDASRLRAYTSTFVGVAPGTKEASGKVPYWKFARSLVSAIRVPEAVWRYWSRVIDLKPAIQYRAQLAEEGRADLDHFGRINVLQERGCKARVVATPNAWTQWLFEPLHRALADINGSLPGSCVEDQNLGGLTIQSWFETNTPVWCFDLSSATDRFPAWIQEDVLRWLGLPEFADGLDEVRRGWVAPSPVKGDWCYAVGQPMGLYGSFPLFHFTHWLLLRACELKAGKSGTFLVLGDDVAICDEQVARFYRYALRCLGVTISDSKSVHSDRVAEFAGFLAVKTDSGVSLFRPYKWGDRGQRGYQAPLNLLANLGPKSKKILWLGRYYDAFRHTTQLRYPDLSPLVPNEQDAGLNPPVLDSVRLTNLITHVDMGNQILSPHLDVPYWDDEGWDDSDLIQSLATALVRSQPEAESEGLRGWRNGLWTGLTTPDIRDETVDFGRNLGFKALKSDPLIRESLSRLVESETRGSGPASEGFPQNVS